MLFKACLVCASSLLFSIAYATNFAVTRYDDGVYSVNLETGKWMRLSEKVPSKLVVEGIYAVGEFPDGIYSYNITDGKVTKLHNNIPMKYSITGDYLVAVYTDGVFSINLETAKLLRLNEALPREIFNLKK